MRRLFRKILKKQFYMQLLKVRGKLGYTQNKMSEILCMDPRSYINLDHGKSCCSAVTLALYLIYVCPDPIEFLKILKDAYESEQKSMASK